MGYVLGGVDTLAEVRDAGDLMSKFIKIKYAGDSRQA